MHYLGHICTENASAVYYIFNWPGVLGFYLRASTFLEEIQIEETGSSDDLKMFNVIERRGILYSLIK